MIFSVRMQSSTSWRKACTSGNGTLDLSTASPMGTTLDKAAWPGTGTSDVSHTDTVDIGFANQVTTYDFALDGDMHVIPEPSTYALLAPGLAGIAGIARRRKIAA